MSKVLEPVTLDVAEVATLSELYREETQDASPEWYDLTPDVEVTPDGGEGFAGVRIY